jgi:hypothetical protein
MDNTIDRQMRPANINKTKSIVLSVFMRGFLKLFFIHFGLSLSSNISKYFAGSIDTKHAGIVIRSTNRTNGHIVDLHINTRVTRCLLARRCGPASLEIILEFTSL